MQSSGICRGNFFKKWFHKVFYYSFIVCVIYVYFRYILNLRFTEAMNMPSGSLCVNSIISTTLGCLPFDQKMNGTVQLCESSSRINALSDTSSKSSMFCACELKASQPLPVGAAHPATEFLISCFKRCMLKMTTLTRINKITALLFKKNKPVGKCLG